MADSSLPLLKLVIEKGPRSGETHEFLPTQPPIRIGRVVRGNTLPIKDPGISTKHLVIEFKSDKWVIIDNDSSNGTVLNNTLLEGMVETVVCDGDVVKIGEVTVIRFGIVVLGKLGDGFGRNDGKKVRGRGKEEKGEILGGNERKVSTRRTRSSKDEVTSLNVAEEIKNGVDDGLGREKNEKVEIFGGNESHVSTRRTRSSKDEVTSLNVVEETENGEDGELGLGGDLGKKARGASKKEKGETLAENVGPIGRRTRTRSSKNEVSSLNAVEEFKNEEDGKELGEKARGRPKKEKVEVLPENVGTRTTRSTRSTKNEISNLSVIEEIGNEEVGVAAEVVEKKTQRGRGRKGKEKAVEGVDLGERNTEMGNVKAEQISTMRTRSSRVTENGERDSIDANDGGVKLTKNGKKRDINDNEKISSGERNFSEKSNIINVQSGDGLSLEKIVVKSEPRDSLCGVGNVVGIDKGDGGEDRGSINANLGKEKCVEEHGSKDGEVPDLEKMTLGEWFDYLDVYLPKTIYEETEQIIADMYKKAEKFREFVHDHEKEKGKGTLPGE